MFQRLCEIFCVYVSGRDVYIFGGEYLFGYGDWQTSVWRWDSFKDLWHIETKYCFSLLPRLELGTLNQLGLYYLNLIHQLSFDSSDIVLHAWLKLNDNV